MGIMDGKKGIIFGVSNKRGIGYAIAKALHDQGAEVGFSYAGEIMESRVRPIAEEMNSKLIISCDVTKDSEIKKVFSECKEVYGHIDFIVHAVAYANRDDLTGNFSDLTIEGWDTAMHVSAYSLIPMAKYGKELMPNGGNILTLSYLGSERSVPNYNVMGIAKAALEANVRYLASELGPQQITVNALSAGPVKTLAAKGITGFDILLKVNGARSPLKRNVTLEEVGNSGLYLCSPLSSGVTGEVHHVDCGYHSVATTRADAKIIGINADE